MQTSTTGVLANIALEMITGIRMTHEHNAPMSGLVSKYTLQKGSDTAIFPKAGQMSLSRLEEGEDIVDEEDIGITTSSVTTSEVGAKVIITRRLLNRISTGAGGPGGIWRTVGEQLGDGSARLMDTDLLDLISALNGGTDLGSAGVFLTAANFSAIASIAKTNKFGGDLRFVAHPNTVMHLSNQLSTIGSGLVRPIPAGFSADILSKVWSGMQLYSIPIFEDGNMSRDGSDDAICGVFNKDALGVLMSQGAESERTWDPSRRAWELVIVSEYQAFELDDSHGAPVTLAAQNPTLA
jgi:hypothetical protein